jgi:crossover junction endodeoxyribonuclease RuvC
MKKSLPRSTGSPTVVLGIDPGTLVTGFGVVARRNGRVMMVEFGTITNSPREPLPQRLKRIYSGLCGLIDRVRPDQCAIESAFYGKNAQSALKLGHARGVAILAAVERDIPTAEYSPREVKKAVVGTGSASKEQVRFMVKALLGARDSSMLLDASDAVAIALCHLQRGVPPSVSTADWRSFIAAHPERVRA